MTYEEAILKSLTMRWKVTTCSQGEQCWCRAVVCEQPLLYRETPESKEEEYYPIRPGEVHKIIVEHIVKTHNHETVFNT